MEVKGAGNALLHIFSQIYCSSNALMKILIVLALLRLLHWHFLLLKIKLSSCNNTETATLRRCLWQMWICNGTHTSFSNHWRGGPKLCQRNKNDSNFSQNAKMLLARLLPNLEHISMANFERSESYLDGEDHLPILASFQRLSPQILLHNFLLHNILLQNVILKIFTSKRPWGYPHSTQLSDHNDH